MQPNGVVLRQCNLERRFNSLDAGTQSTFPLPNNGLINLPKALDLPGLSGASLHGTSRLRASQLNVADTVLSSKKLTSLSYMISLLMLPMVVSEDVCIACTYCSAALITTLR